MNFYDFLYVFLSYPSPQLLTLIYEFYVWTYASYKQEKPLMETKVKRKLLNTISRH